MPRIITPERLFVVEYSMLQNAVHTRSLRGVIENNQKNLANGVISDYVPVGLLNSRQEADWFVVHFLQETAPMAQLEYKSRNWQSISAIIFRLMDEAIERHLRHEDDDSFET